MNATSAKKFIRLARALASRVLKQKRLPRCIEFNDLVQTGMAAALGAEKRWDPGKGASLTTYLARRMQGAMLDDVREFDPLTRAQRRQEMEELRRRELLAQQLGRSPLTAGLGQSEEGVDGDSVVSPLAPPDAMATATSLAFWADSQIQKQLTERQKLILVWTRVLRGRRRDVANALGVSPSAVSQALKRAQRQLRTALKEEYRDGQGENQKGGY